MNRLRTIGRAFAIPLVLLFLTAGMTECSRDHNYQTQPPDVTNPISPAISTLIPISTSAPAPQSDSLTPDAWIVAVRDAEAFQPMFIANGGEDTGTGSNYANMDLTVRIQPRPEESLVAMLTNAPFAGVSVLEYALQYQALSDADIETRIAYTLSARTPDVIVLTQNNRHDPYDPARDSIYAAKDSEELYVFLKAYYDWAALSNGGNAFLEQLPESVTLCADVDVAIQSFAQGGDFVCLTIAQYTERQAALTQAGYTVFLDSKKGVSLDGRFISPELGVTLLIYRPGLAANNLTSMISGTLFATDGMPVIDNTKRGGYDYRYAFKQESLDWLYNNNLAGDIVNEVLRLQAAATRTAYTFVSDGELINADMLRTALEPNPPGYIKINHYLGKRVVDLSENEDRITFAYTYEPSGEDVDIVIGQDPAPNTYLRVNQKDSVVIQLTVSEGNDQSAEGNEQSGEENAQPIDVDVQPSYGHVIWNESDKWVVQFKGWNYSDVTNTGISAIIDENGTVQDLAEFVRNITKYAQNYNIKTITLDGYVSTKYADGEEWEGNKQNSADRARAVAAYLSQEDAWLREHIYFVSIGRGGIYSGTEGKYNSEDCIVKISFAQ